MQMTSEEPNMKKCNTRLYIYIYIYTYREREREGGRGRGRKRERERETVVPRHERGCRLRRSEVPYCAACLSASGQQHITQRHVAVQLHSFMTSALGGAQWSTTHTGCLTPVDRTFRFPPNKKLGGPQRRSGCLEFIVSPRFEPR